MRKYSAYAGQIEITATAHILKRNIRVYVMKQGKYSNVGLGYEINQSKDKDITLFHNMKPGKAKGGHHFEILFPTSKANVVTKAQYDKFKSKSKMKKDKKKKDKKKRAPTKRKMTRRRSRRP
jgi:hypothetical protein